MISLNDFIPNPPWCEIDAVRVNLPASAAFEAALAFDLTRSPLVAALRWIRTLPEHMMLSDKRTLAERAIGDSVTPIPNAFRAMDFAKFDTGVRLLAAQPGRLIVGAIGRLWEPSVTFSSVPPEGFAAYDQPGWGKVAWELRCEDDGDGSRIIVEQRATATDEEARRKLQRHLRLVGPFSRFIRRHTLALIARELGATAAPDATRAAPGNEQIVDPKEAVTLEITIDAAPPAAWRWLARVCEIHSDEFERVVEARRTWGSEHHSKDGAP